VKLSRPIRPLAAAAACAALLLAVPGSAEASRYAWSGRAVLVADGDTIKVDVYGDGTTAPVTIRNNGLDAMETGTCKAAAATAALRRLVPAGSKIRLEANNAKAIAPDGAGTRRPLRVIYNSAGVDVQKALLEQGLGLWFPFSQDPMNQRLYAEAAQRAAAAGVGLYDQTRPCRTGPYQSADLEVWISWDADGDDRYNVNGEWIKVKNNGASVVYVGGWWLRTSAHPRFTFPAGTAIQPGGVVTLHVGKGARTATRFYWGHSAPLFPNTGLAPVLGNGAYLFDPDGDLRAWSVYPCVHACASPLAGQVRVTAVWDPPGDESKDPNLESVRVTNVSSGPADLSHQVLQVGGSTYEIAEGTVLGQGDQLVVRIGKGTRSTASQFWGRTTPLLVNAGGTALLRTPENTVISCAAWGSGRC
jgi:endonuclease YncB( thermonuclease family)